MSSDIVCIEQFKSQNKLSEHTFTFLMAGASSIYQWVSVFVERTQTAEDHLVSLWEFLEEESIIAHKLACSCDRHNFLSVSAQGGERRHGCRARR